MQMQIKKVSELNPEFQPDRRLAHSKSQRGVSGETEWSKELILETISRRHEEGRPLIRKVVLKKEPKLVAAAKRYLGNWYKAVLEAGFGPRQIKGKWNRKKIITEIQQRKETGKPINAQAV